MSWQDLREKTPYPIKSFHEKSNDYGLLVHYIDDGDRVLLAFIPGDDSRWWDRKGNAQKLSIAEETWPKICSSLKDKEAQYQIIQLP